MKIIVTVKQVPDPDIPPTHFRVDEAARKVVPPAGVAPVMNGYDGNALEAALRLKEKHGGDRDGPDARRRRGARHPQAGHRDGRRRGRPRQRSGPARCRQRRHGAPCWPAAIQKIGEFDLVLSGRQASDTDAGQVPLGIAEILGSAVGGAGHRDRAVRRRPEGQPDDRGRLPGRGGARCRRWWPSPARSASRATRPCAASWRPGGRRSPSWTAADLGLDRRADAQATLRRLYVEQREAKVELIEADTPEEAGDRAGEPAARGKADLTRRMRSRATGRGMPVRRIRWQVDRERAASSHEADRRRAGARSRRSLSAPGERLAAGARRRGRGAAARERARRRRAGAGGARPRPRARGRRRRAV